MHIKAKQERQSLWGKFIRAATDLRPEHPHTFSKIFIKRHIDFSFGRGKSTFVEDLVWPLVSTCWPLVQQ
jgi:hypothetical protein